MNAYIAVTIINVALIVLVGLCCWITSTAWPLFGLLFMYHTSSSKNSVGDVSEQKESLK